MIAVEHLAQRTFGTEARLGFGDLQRLQRVGLGQLHFVFREARLARHFGQQRQHVGRMRRQRIGAQVETIHAGAGADAAAHALGCLGNRLGVTLGGAFGEQAGEQVGEARMVGVIDGVAGVLDCQHEVHAGHAVARHHPDLHAVVQGRLRDVRHRQGLVLGVGRQLLGQFDIPGGHAASGEGQRHAGGEQELVDQVDAV